MSPEITNFFDTWGKNPLVVAITVAILTLALQRFLPWLIRQFQGLGEATVALVGGGWHDYQFERKYLDWLIGRHRYLGQLPSNVAVATGEQKQLAELEQVYVALSVTPGGASGEHAPEAEMQARFLRREKPAWWMRFIPERFRPDDERPYSNIGQVVEKHPRLVIRGDPGSGKTTLMKFIAVTCARALRNKPREGDNRKLAYERLGWKDRPFPVLVSLGRHGRVTSWEKGRTLLDACAEEFDRELAECPAGFFERRLKRGGCLILLDAFDELGSREARQQMAQLISGLLNKFSNAKNRIVVTTRIVGYEGQLDTRDFTVQTVQPLTDDDIESLVRQRYRAIALQEGANRPESEMKLAQRRASNKADQLLVEIRRNDRLHSLAVNPLLLSLIVLDHSVKLVLPEERHILYRDCVEILAAKWRQQRRAEMNVAASDDSDLSLTQKIDLLQAIALEMQKQRARPDAGQIPIRRARAEELIAAQLPNLLSLLPSDASDRRKVCEHKAAAWLDGVKAESGILIELGLDDAGEPLVAFSHLTFQEYLAALAIKEQTDLYSLLLDNLLNPAWEEVVLLYVGIAQEEATPMVRELVARTNNFPNAWLVAGRVLTERTKVDEAERQIVMDGLYTLIQTGDESQRARGCEILADIKSPQSAPGLVQVAEKDTRWKVRYAAAQALGAIGDPRFDHIEPAMVPVPAGEFVVGDDNSNYEDERPQHVLTLAQYRIGKYPITNAEYKRFVDETGYAVPFVDQDWARAYNWDQQKHTCPQGRANHPIVLVSWHDARAYCEWLSKKSGKPFRLPTEAEWEKAARGPLISLRSTQDDENVYPWGKEFDKDKCNTSESGIGTTTPVGIYLNGASTCGAMDMAGNVWEWCSTKYANYPYQANDGREDSQSSDSRILRGGSWYNNQGFARCAYRGRYYPGSRGYYLGFRVAESVPS